MTSKILKSIIFVAVSVLLASIIVITGVQYKYFSSRQETQLRDELKLVARATQMLGKSYLEGLKSDRYRFTWVNTDGKVIFDSRADIATIGNHANREEIKEAFISGTGSSIRQSSTLTEQTVYEAIRLTDGTVLRISISRATELALILDMVHLIAFVLIIAIIFSFLLARHMAKRVVEPLNNLNLEKPMENKVYEELSPLLYRIHAQHLEIKNQVEILKHKQDEFEQITSNMKEALVLLDSTDRIFSINPAARKLFNAENVTIGESFLSIDRKQNMNLALLEAKEKGYYSFRDQKNGREYQFDINRIDTKGKKQGIVILAFDITEQVNAEKNRREFTANVSHELKTPLQSIIGSAELMENGIVKEEDVPRFLRRIKKEATRLVNLINDIIRLSQLDEGAEMLKEKVYLREIIEEVRETLLDAAEKKNVSIEVTGNDAVFTGNRRLLYEIIYNLCDNAVKYNKPNGKVKISLSDEEGVICLNVQDTGIGISLEHQEKVFERFYRVDKSHSKHSGGTGLGLSIVKNAVKYHHGKLLMESEIDRGTSISVFFKYE